MGNEISHEPRLSDAVGVPLTFNGASRSRTTEMCQTAQKSDGGSPAPNNCLALIGADKTCRDSLASEDRRAAMSACIQFGQSKAKYRRAETNDQGTETRNNLSSNWSYGRLTAGYRGRKYESKLKDIRETVISLDDGLRETRDLESERSLRYSRLKTINTSLRTDLEKANKRNKNMLNLFRQNAAEVGFGHLRISSTLPEPLRKNVQRVWSQKYDALLERTNQLQKEVTCAELSLKDKDQQIEDLQQRLLNLADQLIQREKTIKKICTKFLSLKQRKDEQEILLRGSVETLQDALQKATATAVTSSKSESSMTPSKDALLAREKRRSDRLAHENSLLRALLHDAKRSCRSSGTSSTISLCDKNF